MTNNEQTPVSVDTNEVDEFFDEQALYEANNLVLTGDYGDQRKVDQQVEAMMAKSPEDSSDGYVDRFYDEDASNPAAINVSIGTHGSLEVFQDAVQRKAQRDLASTALENSSTNEPSHPVAS